MKSDIDGVAQSIQEAETQLLKYEQSIREIASLKFDSLESQFDSAFNLALDQVYCMVNFLESGVVLGGV